MRSIGLPRAFPSSLKIAASSVILMLSLIIGPVYAQIDTLSNRIVGKFKYSAGGPSDINGDTINVSDTMVAMSEMIKVLRTIKSQTGNGEAPSIFFVIDHSGSMATTDPNGNRFTVTLGFIDSVAKYYPNAEVGLALFDNTLRHRKADDALFDTLRGIYRGPYNGSNYYTSANAGGYIPLLTLNNNYTSTLAGTTNGRNILKYFLDTAVCGNHVGLKNYRRCEDGSYTNISLGFRAAKNAMQLSTHTPARQFIIFLSDGDANQPGTPETFYFRDNTSNVPTTFTVYFTSTGTVLTNLTTMTSNIKNNGYSTSNFPYTAAWANENYSRASLLNFMIANILTPINSYNVTQPSQITINGITVTNYDAADTLFAFANNFPLTGRVTPFNIALKYSNIVNGVPVSDTTYNINYWVRTMLPGTSPLWRPGRDSFAIKKWSRNLKFEYANAYIPEIQETMNQVQLYFTFDSVTMNYPYSTARVKLMNKTAPIDSEFITLTQVTGQNLYTGSFNRAVSATAAIGDGILQYRGASDSIIAVFRNRESTILPLDTVRRAIGFVDVNMQLSLSDTVLTAGDTTKPLRAIVTNSKGTVITDPAFLNRIVWTQLAPLAGDQLIGTTGASSRFTATMAWRDTVRLVAALPLYNGVTKRDTVKIYVKPAATSHLVIEASSTPLTTSPHADNRLGSVTISLTQTTATGYAILRDRFGNYVANSNPTAWSSNEVLVVTVPANGGGTASLGQGIFTKVGPAGVAQVTAVGSGFSDVVIVNVNSKTYDSVRIAIRNPSTGQYVRITQLTLPIGRDTTLWSQGFANGVWETVPIDVDWSKTASLNTSQTPGTRNSFNFTAQDTGHGRIKISFHNGFATTIYDSISVVFTPGPATTIAIYPQAGQPGGSNALWPADPLVADTVSADSLFTLLYAKVFTNSGKIWLSDYETRSDSAQKIHWTVTPVDDDTLTIAAGNHSELKARRANREVTITATLGALSYSINVWVVPGRPHHIVIEASPNIRDTVNDDPLSQLLIPFNQTSGSAYAILRDQFGNFTGYSTVTQWSSSNTGMVTASSGTAAIGQGIATRNADSGTALLIAYNATYNTRDSVPVMLQNVQYTALRIYTLNNSTKVYPDTITIATDGSLKLYVEGQRSDGLGWDNVPGDWSKTTGLKTIPATPPTGVNQWNVVPDSVGTGWIKVSQLVDLSLISDSVYAKFVEGPANNMALYRHLGDPRLQSTFPAIDTIAAGTTDTIVAKIFDRNHQWLSSYENIAVSGTLISWTITRLSGPAGGGSDPLGVTAGHISNFSPTIAYTMYRIIARFNNGSVQCSSSVQIYVTPSPIVHHLVIEQSIDFTGNTALLLGNHPYDTMKFLSRDVEKNGYAVLRDRFNNYVGLSQNTFWQSVNTALVTAKEGSAIYGEGLVDRVGALGQTLVIAQNRLNTAWIDTMAVVLSAFSYDSLKIVVRDSVQIQSLQLRSDQDTLLQVLGLRSFGGWVPVSGNWVYNANLGGTSANNLASWRFKPTDSGRGQITVSYTGAVPASIAVTVLPGLPAKLVLYQNSTIIPDPSTIIPATAGVTYAMTAKIFDWRGVYLGAWAIPPASRTIVWGAASEKFRDILDGKLDSTIGASQRLTLTRAYDTVKVVAKLQYDATHAYADTARFVVGPGGITHVVIEASPDPFTVSPNFDNPLGGPSQTIILGPSQQSDTGYAVMRDQFQNFVSFSTNTSWDNSAPAIVTVSRGGATAIGEGVIHKTGPDGSGLISVTDVPTGDKDTVTVIVSQVVYDSLRIMQYVPGTGYVRAYQITLRKIDSTTLYVQGFRRDGLGWELVPGYWSISPTTLHTNHTPPQGQNSWSFSPLDTGHGTISVYHASGVNTSIAVTFLPGLPNLIAIYPAAGTPGVPHPAAPLIADVAIAGVEYTKLYAKVFDGTVWLRQYDSLPYSGQIVWSVTPAEENSFSIVNSNATKLTSTRAFRTVRVTATLGQLSYSIVLNVRPGPVDHIVIEASPAITDSINDQPLGQVVIPTGTTRSPAYAIRRDAYGNYIGYSTVTNWSSTATTIFSTLNGNTAIGEGFAVRIADFGTGFLIAADSVGRPGVTMRDTVPVTLSNIYYKSLRIYTNNPYNNALDTLRIPTDGSQTLYVEGERSDGTGWDPLPATWIKSATLKTQANPPTGVSDRWTVTPDSTGTGWIKVTDPTAGSDSVWVIFQPGSPNSMVLYKNLGNPAVLSPFPAIDTVVAGVTDTIVAKIFDRNHVWLSAYENIAVSSALIKWTSKKLSGPGATADTLRTKTGHITTFMSPTAYCLYTVTATFTNGTTVFIDSAQIYVKPGPANHLVIEETSNIVGNLLIDDNPLDTLGFDQRQPVRSCYAILRDQFGNFVSYSLSTRWSSINLQIVTAAEGAAMAGEGIVTRIGTSGKSKVVAVNRANPLLFDTVDVVLGKISYDSLRIVVRDSVSINNLTMRSDQDTLLQVLGLPSTGGAWVPVIGNWNYTATLGGATATGISWRFNPGDTGTGRIIVTLGSATPDTLIVKIIPGLPASLVLYPKEDVPGPANLPLPPPTQLDSVAAGTPYLIVGKVFDKKGVWLSEYQLTNLQNLVSWGAEDRAGNLNSTLDGLTGAVRRFTPTKAFDTVAVIGTLQASANTILLDTVRIKILPGPGVKIVLEKSTKYPLNTADPQDTLTIQGNQQTGSVYAVLRDAYNNYVSFADIQSWGTLDTSIAAAQKGNILIGEGVAIRRDSSGFTKMFAVDNKNRKDTCVVRLVPYNITQLRIIAGKDTVPLNHAVLTMNTNQDTTLYVQGLREDNSQWVDVSAKWLSSAKLPVAPTAPLNDHAWKFSPTDTAAGWIKVALIDIPGDSLPVRFTPGPPVRASIEIITAPADIIAGRPILAVVKVYDEDGNSYSYTFDTTAGGRAAYHDTLGTGGAKFPEPFIIVDGDTLLLDGSPWGSGNQTFVNGIDTVSFTVYNAPSDTTKKHQIYTNLIIGADTVRAASNRFTLHPDSLSSIKIEYTNGAKLPDTLNLSGSITVVARGYDRYGNLIGDIPGNWSTTDSLHAVDRPDSQSSIFYDAGNVKTNEAGYLIVDHNGTRDSVYIKIHGPLIRLISAITRDTSGNGILDRIELYFSRKFSIPATISISGLAIVNNLNDTLIDTLSIIANLNDTLHAKRIINAGQKDSIVIVELTETDITRPQTAWTPKIHIGFQSRNPNKLDLAPLTVTATDGAGPVIWFVEKRLGKGNIRTNDTVLVMLSERVQKQNKSNLTLNEKPGLMFYAWTQTAGGAFVKVDSMFLNIDRLMRAPGKDSVIEFYMLNGMNLNANHWVSLDTATRYIADVTVQANLPNDNNQRVRVVVTGNPETPVVPVPNPMRPTLTHDAGGFKVENNPNAIQWVKTERSGTALQFDIAVPDKAVEPNVKVNVRVRIYDVIGNTVQSNENKEYLQTLNTTEASNDGIYSSTVYWNGTNAQGMICAPGVYRVVVYLQYSGFRNKDFQRRYPDRRKIAMIGIGR